MRLELIWRRISERATAYPVWLGLLVCLATTGLVYGRSLVFPFFYDDSFDLTRTETQTFLSLLQGTDGYAYYRPLPFLIWKLLYQIEGRYDPLLLHGLSLVSHLAAGWLLYLLLHRLTGTLWSLVPAVLFLSFPYGYQVVAVAGSLFHSLVAVFILASLYLHLRGRQEGRPVLLLASTLMLTLGLWTHEYGVLGLGFILALEIFLLASRQVRRPTRWLLADLAVAGVFLVSWLSVNKAPSPVPASRDELIAKGLFFLQGMAYPATAQLVLLQQRAGRGLADETLLFAVPAVLVGLLAYLLAGRRVVIGLAGIGWALIALLPVWWRLNWPYVENAPRLLYLAAMGAATFWGMLLSLRWRRPGVTTAWRLAGLLVVALVLLQSARFISIRLDMLSYGGQVVDGLATVGEAQAGRSILFMNVPSWFVQHQQDYVRGHLGVTMLPSYIGLDRVIYAHTGARLRVESLGFRADTDSWRYGWQPHGPNASAEQVDAAIRSVNAVYVADMAPEQLSIRPVGGLLRAGTAGSPIAGFEPGVDLMGASVSGSSGVLVLELEWRVWEAFAGGTDVVVVLRDESGKTVVEWRGFAMNDLWAPEFWRPGDRIDDRSVLRLPVPSAEGPYSVWLGFASQDDGRLIPLRQRPPENLDPHLLKIGTVER